MKKIFFLLAAIIAFSGASIAQTATQTTTVKQNTIQTSKHLTKDGQPDKRYKENKTQTTTKATGPVKKDGTPDMRYKANKKTTTIQQSTTN